MLTFDPDINVRIRIGELAKEVERSVPYLKKLEKEGVLPKPKRDSRGWRYYTDEDVTMIERAIF